MKKILKGLATALVMIIFCALGAVGGFVITTFLFSGLFDMLEAIAAIVGIVAVFYLSILIHEAGHLVFGLASGYGFSSFRIGSLMWIKIDGKIQLRRLSVAGTGGQCLMVPPEAKNGKIPVILYNLGGVLINLLTAMILIAIGYILSDGFPLLSFVLVIGGLISVILALSNGIPLNIGGIANDGMNAIHLSKNPDAATAFRNQLLMNAAQAKGMRISDMPDEWFVLSENADMQNVHNASIAVFSVSRWLDKGDTERAESEISDLLKSNYNVTGLHKSLLRCDLVFAKLVNHEDGADLSSLLTMEQLKFMKSMKTFPSVIRTEYAIALLRDNDETKAQKLLDYFDKIAKKYPYPSEIESERELIELARNSRKNHNIKT